MASPVSPNASANLAGRTATGLSPRAAAMLAYSAWWVSGGLFLFLEPAHPFVRFHARQAFRALGLIWLTGVGLWVLGLLAAFVSVPILRACMVAAQMTWTAGAGLWVACLVQAWRGKRWSIPGLPVTPADADRPT